MSAEDSPGNEPGFLQRWSRRKQAVREGVVPDDVAAQGTAPPAAIAAQPVAQTGPDADPNTNPRHTELPSLDSLQGLQSDYLDFMQPEVAQHLKRAALKKLFADPHFNVIDRFEAYSEDYTQADPIPAAMLRGLNQAKGLLFPHDDPKPDDPKPDDPKPDDSKPDEPNQERALHAALDPLRNAEVEIETPAETRSEARSETWSETRALSDGLKKHQ
jgi:hypothetical protein